MCFFLCFIEIPPNVQRCCTRCYEKLIIQVRQQQTTITQEEEDDDDDESSKTQSTNTDQQTIKHNDGKKKFNLPVFF